MLSLRNHVANAVKIFLPLAVAITILSGSVYVAVQQSQRQNANDPQIEYAEGLATQFGGSGNIPTISPSIDIATSLSTWVAIFDENGKILQSSGVLNNAPPALPSGIFDQVKSAGQDRITWEPQPGVRVALVIMHYQGARTGYVAVGRSLREVESRIAMLGWYVFGAWLLSLIACFITIILLEAVFHRWSSPTI